MFRVQGMKSKAVTVLAAAAALGGLATTAEAAPAAVSGTIANNNSGLCLAVPGPARRTAPG